MKNILVIFCALLVGNVFCQSDDWKQLPSPDKTFMNEIYMTSKGSLFGLDFYSQKFQYKHKSENKWEDVALFNLSKSDLDEDKDGNLYFSNDIYIYKYNEDSLKASKVFNLTGLYPYFNNFKVLDNGDFLVNSGGTMMRYSKHGLLKNAKKFTYGYLVKKDSGTIYLNAGSSPEILLKIDTLFNILDSVEFINPLLLISNHRLFGTEKFSDDFGRTWKQYPINNPFDYIYDISKGHDGTIFLSTYNQIYYSIDNGDTYNAIQVFGPNGSISNGIKYISSSKNHEIVALVNRDGCAGTIYWSPDFGKTWEIIPIKNDVVFSEAVLANDEKEYFVKNLCNYRSLNSLTSKWDDYTFKVDGLDIYPTDLEYDKDGYLFAKGVNKSFIKEPNQNEWKVSNSSMWHKLDKQFFLHKHKNILYGYFAYDQSVSYSVDHGLTWQKLPIKNNLGYDLFFTHSKKAFAITGTNKISYFDLEQNLSEVFKVFDNFRILDATTTYGNNDLYVIGDGMLYETKMIYTRDNGITWNEIPINKQLINPRMVSDYNNNIFVYQLKTLLVLEHDSDTIKNISPNMPMLSKINDLQLGLDGNIYLATDGAGVLKYEGKLGTGLKEIANESLLIYPNPASDRVTIKHIKPKQIISIFDAMGHLVFGKECSGGEEIVDIDGWKTGLYYVVSNQHSASFVKL